MRTLSLAPDPEGLARAARILVDGGLVAVPTETVYGLAARADSAAAVQKVFEAKGRPGTNPLIVHVAGAGALDSWARDVPELARTLAREYWPGPLTLVLPLRPGTLAGQVTAGGDTVALRAPSHPALRALLEVVQLPLAAPSANRSNSLSPTRASHVLQSLGGRIDAVLDGGPCELGIESTIVAVGAVPPLRVLRHGATPLAELALRWPTVDATGTDAEQERALAPGRFARHYAPRATVLLVPRAELERVPSAQRGSDTAWLVLGACPEGVAGPTRVLPDDPRGYAAELYAALHDLDAAGPARIVIEAPPSTPEWHAVVDRLRRAAAPAP